MMPPKLTALAIYGILPTIVGLALGLWMRPASTADADPPEDTDRKNFITALAATKPDPRLASYLEGLESSDFESLLEKLDALPEHQKRIAMKVAISHWAKLDPVAAVEHIEEHFFYYGVDTRRRVFEEWVGQDFEAAFASLEKDGGTLRIETVLLKLAESEPAKAWSLAVHYDKDLSEFYGLSRKSLEGIFRSWIASDHESAIRAVEASNDRAFEIFASQLALTEPDKITELISSCGKNRAMGILSDFKEHHPELCLAEARKLLDDPDFASDPNFLATIPSLVPHLSQEQLRQIAEHRTGSIFRTGEGEVWSGCFSLELWQRIYEEVDEFRTDPQFRREYAVALGEDDPRAGLEWLETLDPHERDRLAPILIEQWAEGSQVEDAISYLRNLPESETELIFRSLVASSSFQDNLSSLRSRIDNEIDLLALYASRLGMGEELQLRAIAWFDSVSAEKQTELISEAPDAVLEFDPGSVVRRAVETEAWADSFLAEGETINIGPVEWAPTYARIGLERWMEEDQENATRWLFDEASLETREALISEMRFEDNPFGPGDEPQLPLYQWMSTISDPALRMQSMRELALTDMNSPVSQLENADIPESVRGDLQELQDSGPDGP